MRSGRLQRALPPSESSADLKKRVESALLQLSRLASHSRSARTAAGERKRSGAQTREVSQSASNRLHRILEQAKERRPARTVSSPIPSRVEVPPDARPNKSRKRQLPVP
jgi:hypothetical protein